MQFSNGDVYEGEWVNDEKDGKGVYKYANQDYYEGYFNKGKRNGKGFFQWSVYIF